LYGSRKLLEVKAAALGFAGEGVQIQVQVRFGEEEVPLLRVAGETPGTSSLERKGSGTHVMGNEQLARLAHLRRSTWSSSNGQTTR